MKELPKEDVLVPWLWVNYDVGEIQNEWRLSAQMANPFDAKAELILYRDPIGLGKSMFMWDLKSPTTAVVFQIPGGVLKSMAMSVRLHQDGMRRSDIFQFNRNPSNENKRLWGTALVHVDDKEYKFVVPSSLFTYTHGITEPGNSQRVKRQVEER